jgi:hypothetical protein
MGVLVAFVVGCVAGSRAGVQRAEAASIEQRWAYFCFEASSIDDLHTKANAAGLRGWEMSAASNSTWCFRQRRSP